MDEEDLHHTDIETGIEEIDTLSDDEFLSQGPNASAPAVQQEEQPSKGGDQPTAEGAETTAEKHTTPHQPEASEEPEDGEDGEAAKGNAGGETVAQTPAQEAPKAGEAPTEAPDYEALYKQIMAPFKANGREFAPSSPEELVRLAQMGANYTKKMQALKPVLRMTRMLENNNLLDEQKLAFLIDLDKKDPKAIQKLIHDSKIDPLDLDVASAPTYTPGNHSVSDQEMQFQEALGDVSSTDLGKQTISLIHSNWDQASKEALFKEPALLSIINDQRANGIYDRICAEIDRQRTLGYLSDTPFIQAYRLVGDRLHQAGQLAPQSQSQPNLAQATMGQMQQQPQVLETRAATQKPTVANGDKAKAASPGPKASNKPSAKPFDPFNMSDEEIMAISPPRA